ncbi:MAG: hypothetical protein QOI92_2029 [Chloroflexota bacterium]|jgi:hypothetical protein|nr:hypothetical protein [Chloroflexota bacterium]
MTTNRDLDLLLPSWFDERVASNPPADLLARSLGRIETVRQRPGWLMQPRPFIGTRTIGRTLVPAWVALAIVAAISVAVVAVGASLLKTAVIPVLPAATTTSSDRLTPAPEASSVPPLAGLLGGGPILAHTFTRYADPGPFDVVAIDADTGSTTLLGTLPGAAATDRCCPYTFMRGTELAPVVILDGALQEATAAAGPFGFSSVSTAARDQIDVAILSPSGNRIAGVHSADQNTQQLIPLDIAVMTLDGTVQARLPIPSGMRWVWPLDWSSDSTALLLNGCRPCNKAQAPTGKQTAEHTHLYIAPVDGSPWTELLDLDNGALAGQFSPDGTHLAVERYVCPSGAFMPRCDPMEGSASLSALNLTTGAETPLGETPGIAGIHWSPDGTLVAYGSRDGAYVVNAATGTKVQLADGQSFGADWSPDGHWLLVNRPGVAGLDSFDIWIVRSDGQQLRRVLTGYAAATW